MQKSCSRNLLEAYRDCLDKGSLHFCSLFLPNVRIMTRWRSWLKAHRQQWSRSVRSAPCSALVVPPDVPQPVSEHISLKVTPGRVPRRLPSSSSRVPSVAVGRRGLGSDPCPLSLPRSTGASPPPLPLHSAGALQSSSAEPGLTRLSNTRPLLSLYTSLLFYTHSLYPYCFAVFFISITTSPAT